MVSFPFQSPVPVFPDYTGPHKVGTIDVELPASELESPSAAPDATIQTVQYRIFYPCLDDGKKKHKQASWIPSPQREYIAAYSRFLGIGSTLAKIISYMAPLLYYIYIPVRKNAPLAEPKTSNGRWPVMLFSHGLGGSRNAYSHLCGSVASHGMIVIAPEHRDGSTPISFIRDVPTADMASGDEKTARKTSRRHTTYTRYSHTPSPEVEAARNTQLKIRLWEMGCIHDSMLKIDNGKPLTNLNSSSASLAQFASKMGVQEPGSIAFAGHSFGAATIVQLLKSAFYAPEAKDAPKEYEPLFTPSSRSAICSQITPNNPVMLLDTWCMPLRAPTVRWLWDKPLPSYAPGGPGGSRLLAVESEHFVKWRQNLKSTKRLLSPDPTNDNFDGKFEGGKAPRFYYPVSSAHLSQSDFGILFPYMTKKIFASEEPERCMTLNIRAVLQVLREAGVEVAPTCKEDMEIVSTDGKTDTTEQASKNDTTIFGENREGVRGWTSIDPSMLDVLDVNEDEGREESNAKAAAGIQEDKEVGGELRKETGEVVEPIAVGA